MRADVVRFSLSDPGDVSGLRGAIESGAIRAETIVAIIGKTHGNGLVNDYTRGYLSQSLAILIGEALGEAADSVRGRIPFIFSGGVEGVLSPHYSVFTAVADAAPPAGPALAIGVAFTPELRPEDLGRRRHIELTAQATRRAMQQAGISSAADVHFVQIKGPAFPSAAISASQRAGHPSASDNPGKLMGVGRAGSAFGVGLALGEISADQAVEANLLHEFSLYSSVASCSAGVEVNVNEVVVLGMSESWSGPLGISHSPLKDALDNGGVHQALASLGFPPGIQLDAAASARIRSAFVKGEASRDGMIRGKPHTMLNDGDIDPQRHIRAALGAMVASVLGDTAIFVSGGAEHQGPDGGGLIAIIAERNA